MLALPVVDTLSRSRSVLIAGAGGGYDVYAGLPLYFGLRAEGKQVHLASLSFANLDLADGERLTEAMLTVTADAGGSKHYFPERVLAEWFRDEGEEVSIHCFQRLGVAPLRKAYAVLAAHLGVDTLVLVDGGTDSLMRGDENGLGTPEEDIASIIAANDVEGISRKLLLCLGFGVDFFHGVCHAQFLQAVADLTREGAFLGTFSILREMPEVQRYLSAVRAVHARIHPGSASIVSTSIASAIEGRYGDYHATSRTAGSRLWINPLMAQYWCFTLDAVARRVLYTDRVRDTQGWDALHGAIQRFRAGIEPRPWEDIPL